MKYITNDLVFYIILSSSPPQLQKKNIFIIDRGVRLYVKYTSQKLILLLVVTYVLVCVKYSVERFLLRIILFTEMDVDFQF